MSRSSMPCGNQLTKLEPESTGSTLNLTSDDLYERLGLTKDATGGEIKAAFRLLSKSLHPDQGGSADEFARLKEAYDILNDKKSRELYDLLGVIRGKDYWTMVQSKAKKQMVDVLRQVVAHEAEPDTSDVVTKILKLLEGGPKSFRQQEKEIRSKMIRVQKMMKRFKAKKPSDFVHGVLQSEVDSCKEQLEAINEARDVHEAMVDIINGYEYEFDQPEESREISQLVGRTFNMTVQRPSTKW